MSQHPTSMSLEALLEQAGLSVPPSLGGLTIKGLSSDSRRVNEGELFIAIDGLHVDARRHIREAADRGAVAVVCRGEEGDLPSCGGECPLPLICVPNARRAMACLYHAWYGRPGDGLRLVAVTGTNGKTSVATMLWSILRGAGVPCGLIGTVECRSMGGEVCTEGAEASLRSGMTTPDPDRLYPLLARMVKEAPKGGSHPPTVVMEVTSHALLLGRVAPLTFALGVFTNLTTEHMDIHGGMEEYYATKRSLFGVCREAVINADDRYGRRLLSEPLPLHRYHICHADGAKALVSDRLCPGGEGGCTRFYAERIRLLGEEGVSFRLTSPTVRMGLRCPVPGDFTVMNAMEAAAAALALGVEPSDIREALSHFSGVTGRMERVKLPETDVPFQVYIDFAHTPDALENLLRCVQGFRRKGQRIVLVFGCGGDRDPSKRRIMAGIASRMAELLVITSDNSRSENPAAILSDILEGVDKESEFLVIPDRAQAIRYAVKHARAGDILLLAGKGHENYEINSQGKHPFSERSIVLQAVKEYHTNSRGRD